MHSVYSVYAKGSKNVWTHIGDTSNADEAQESIQRLRGWGYEVRASITRIKREG